MIETTSFLGISVETRRRRRLLVRAYYVVLLGFLAVAIYNPNFFEMGMVVQTVTLGGIFGGIRSGGLVKPYRKTYEGALHENGIQQLNLSPRRPFGAFEPLDERERMERDRAHFCAYRILSLVLTLVAVGCIIAMEFGLGFVTRNAPELLWSLAVFTLSLPQSVILWTEPDTLPDGQLTLVPQS